MESDQRGQESPVAVRELRGEPKEASCSDCRHVRLTYFGWCRYFDKPTSGQVNGCFGFELRKR